MLKLPAHSMLRASAIQKTTVQRMTLLPNESYQPDHDVLGIRIVSGWVMLTANDEAYKLWAGRTSRFYTHGKVITVTAAGKRPVQIEILLQ